MPPAAAAERKSEVTLRVRCRHCDRVQTRRGRAGIYWRCKHEDCRSQEHRGLNPGPALEAAVMAPRELQRQRRRRTPKTGEGAAGQAPAPVRNAEGPNGGPVQVAAPAPLPAASSTPLSPAPTSEKPGWVQRWIVGTEEAS
jgi:ribosomal protein L37AE/L43A